jgi:hypothetical protein
VTGREPDDPDRTPKEPDTDVDAAFAEIVASWEREHGHAEWPAEADADSEPEAANEDQEGEPEVAEDEGHFIPPEPPPLPRPQPQTVGAGVLFAVGLILLVAPAAIGFSHKSGLILGLLAITGAMVWLMARLRKGPPADSGWDDGAQL